jgi:glycosyltransferase involved in cell wall biosynthesis
MNDVETKPLYPFTVFTATYNRAHTLHRVFESLQAQTFRNFEWVIVDDGSNDDTDKLVSDWSLCSNFHIRYIRQNHAGKNFAFNRGVKEAKGKYFAEIDSDDALKTHALERVNFHWLSIPPEISDNYFAVFAFCEDEHGNLIGQQFTESPCDYDFRKFNYSRKYRSEKWRCFRTEVLRKFPFREDAKECHIFESTLFCEIAKFYKVRFINEVLRIYFLSEPSLTRQIKHPMHNAEGWRLSILYTLNNDLDFFTRRPLHFLRKAMNFARFSFHCKLSLSKQFDELTAYLAKLLWLFTLPIALLTFFLDKFRGNTPEAAEMLRHQE